MFPSTDIPLRHGRARLGDIELAWELAGPTPDDIGAANARLPVILVMGFALPGRGWRFVRPDLAKDRRVLTFDNRGAGESDKPSGRYSMAGLANDVLALADHHGFGRFHLVGVSMGGMIAQHVALRARDRLASLTLIATHAGGFAARLPKPLGIKGFLGANLARTPERRYQAISHLLFPRAFREQVGQEALVSILRTDFEPSAPSHGRRAQLAAIFGHDTRDRLHTLAGLPTLILKPERDLLVRPSGSDTLHRLIPGSRLVAIPDAGHGLIRQSGAEVAHLIAAHADRAES